MLVHSFEEHHISAYQARYLNIKVGACRKILDAKFTGCHHDPSRVYGGKRRTV